MIRILITDDHPVVRQGLTKILEEASDIVVSGEAGSGSELMDCMQQNEYDVPRFPRRLP